MMPKCPVCKKSVGITKIGTFRKYCSRNCSCKAQHLRGEIGFEIFNPRYRGGQHNDRGYRQVRIPGHPLADKKGYVPEHRLVMQDKLFDGCIVHHKNGIKDDNRPENLEVISRAEHNKGHIREVCFNKKHENR